MPLDEERKTKEELTVSSMSEDFNEWISVIMNYGDLIVSNSIIIFN